MSDLSKAEINDLFAKYGPGKNVKVLRELKYNKSKNPNNDEEANENRIRFNSVSSSRDRDTGSSSWESPPSQRISRSSGKNEGSKNRSRSMPSQVLYLENWEGDPKNNYGIPRPSQAYELVASYDEYKFKMSNKNKKGRRILIDCPPNMYKTVFIGDDFLLGVACFYFSFHGYYDDGGVFTSGFCASGNTFYQATQSIKKEFKNKANKLPSTALVYLGSSDIINGRTWNEIEEDLGNFVNACNDLKIRLIFCTLAPIPTHQLGTKRIILKKFNDFIKTNPFKCAVIDIYTAFMRTQESFEELYYNEDPFMVSGHREKLALWSKDGKRRFCNIVKKNLGFALLAKDTKIFNHM